MEITVVPSENGSFQPSTNGHNESQAFKIEIFSPEKTRVVLGRDIPPEIYQQLVDGVRAVKDGGSFRVPARSEHEMALFKKKIREIAPKVENGLKIRFKDEIRRRRHAVTKEWVTRTNFNFMVYKASTGQAQATNGLQKGRGSN